MNRNFSKKRVVAFDNKMNASSSVRVMPTNAFPPEKAENSLAKDNDSQATQPKDLVFRTANRQVRDTICVRSSPPTQ